jgi:GalNAc-alpha-(1->4)-GalNAc-alpha-(1->3)-diNAcBac-PP-undecaprenol alpha-1,4-N-acetyl-D-galactosaminyltransferase
VRPPSDPSILPPAAKDDPASSQLSHDIALIISDLGSGGSQRVLMQLIEAWGGSGRRLAVITLAEAESDFFRLPAGVTRIALSGVGPSHNRFRGFLANLDRIKRLRAALRRIGAPIAVAFIMPTAVLTLLASRGLHIRVIACERNDPERQNFGHVWMALRRITYRWADAVTANSRGALIPLSKFVPRTKLLYVANSIARPPQGKVTPLAHPTVLSIGRLHPQKAHDVLLRAFSSFTVRYPDWRLAIMGEGSAEANLRALAHELGIASRVEWLGVRQDPYPWLRGAHIFALPSRYEGTPNALLEAMSCGLPCIVSDASPGPLDLIENGITGLVTPVDDHMALATALERVANDKDLARKLGEAAQRRAQEHDSEAALQSWEKAFQRVASQLE